MTFPAFRAAPTGSQQNNTTSHSGTLPATIESGDLIITATAFDGEDFTSFDTSGYTNKGSVAAAGLCELEVWVKIADGTEDGGTIGLTTGASQDSAILTAVIEVGTWSGDLADLEFTTANNTLNSNPNPPSLTPSYSSEDVLWLAIMGGDGPRTVTSFPTDYDSLSAPTPHDSEINGGGGGCGVAWGVRELNTAGAEDPGVFVMSTDDQWACVTLSIRPAAAGGATNPKGPLGHPLQGPLGGPVND